MRISFVRHRILRDLYKWFRAFKNNGYNGHRVYSARVYRYMVSPRNFSARQSVYIEKQNKKIIYEHNNQNTRGEINMCGREIDDTSQVPICIYIYKLGWADLISLRNHNTEEKRRVSDILYSNSFVYYNSTHLLLCIKDIGTIIDSIRIPIRVLRSYLLFYVRFD